MPNLLDRQTITVLGIAFLAALFCIHAETSSVFLFVLASHAAYFVETFFHELGHFTTGWLLGVPGLPMIFTLTGPEGSGGLTLTFGHFWIIQIAVYVLLVYGCYELYSRVSSLFYPAVILTIAVVGISLSSYRDLVITYMGHGGTILVSGYFMSRAWLNIGLKTAFNRFLCAFVGFYMAMHNIYMSYNLIHDPETKERYASSHIVNDFIKMTDYVYSWNLDGIATFNMVFGGVMIIASFIASYIFYNLEDGRIDLK